MIEQQENDVQLLTHKSVNDLFVLKLTQYIKQRAKFSELLYLEF